MDVGTIHSRWVFCKTKDITFVDFIYKLPTWSSVTGTYPTMSPVQEEVQRMSTAAVLAETLIWVGSERFEHEKRFSINTTSKLLYIQLIALIINKVNFIRVNIRDLRANIYYGEVI